MVYISSARSCRSVSWDDGENDVISGFDITTVTINPLNYKQMILADKLLVGAKWNLTAFDGIVTKIVGAITSKMPTITWTDIAVNVKAPTAPQISGKDIYLIATTDAGAQYTWAVDPITGAWNWYDSSNAIVTDQKFDLGTDNKLKLQTFLDDLATAINNGANLSSVNTQVKNLITKYNSVKNATGANIMNRVNGYLQNVTDKLMGAFDNAPCWKLTEPTLLFESREGINRMYPFTDADGSMKFAAGKYTFIMTSLTEEYIVPVYRKYIALIYGGKVKFAQSFAGDQKIVQIDVPNEACEIVYQTCDYYGNVVTKRYPINRN